MCCHLIFIFLIFSLVFLNNRVNSYSLSNHMSVFCHVSFILNLFHLFITSFKLFCFSSDTSYLSISDIHASCAFPFHCLSVSKGMSLKLIIKKSHTLLLTSYIFRISPSYSASSSLVISHIFVKYLRTPVCLAISLVFYFQSSNLS